MVARPGGPADEGDEPPPPHAATSRAIAATAAAAASRNPGRPRRLLLLSFMPGPLTACAGCLCAGRRRQRRGSGRVAGRRVDPSDGRGRGCVRVPTTLACAGRARHGLAPTSAVGLALLTRRAEPGGCPLAGPANHRPHHHRGGAAGSPSSVRGLVPACVIHLVRLMPSITYQHARRAEGSLLAQRRGHRARVPLRLPGRNIQQHRVGVHLG
jgi:hypothetical protein